MEPATLVVGSARWMLSPSAWLQPLATGPPPARFTSSGNFTLHLE